jgi:starch synthase
LRGSAWQILSDGVFSRIAASGKIFLLDYLYEDYGWNKKRNFSRFREGRMTTKQSDPSQNKSRRGAAQKNLAATPTAPTPSQNAPLEKVSPAKQGAADILSAEILKPDTADDKSAAPSPAESPKAGKSETQSHMEFGAKPPDPASEKKNSSAPMAGAPAKPAQSSKPLVSLGDALEAMKAEIPIAKAEKEIASNKSSDASVPVTEAKAREKSSAAVSTAPAPKIEKPIEREPELGAHTAAPVEEKKEAPKVERAELKVQAISEPHTKSATEPSAPQSLPKPAPVIMSPSKRSEPEQKPSVQTPAPKEPEKKVPEQKIETPKPELPKIERPKPSSAPQPESPKIEPKPELPKAEEQKPESQPQSASQSPPEPQPPPRRRVPPMFVVQITPELAPVAKVGGLADVVFGLSRELEIRGNAVEIILPKYDCMKYNHVWGLSMAYENLRVPWFGGSIHTSVWFGFVHGRKCFFIDPHSADNFFSRGVFYGQNDDVLRFAFFCRAAMEFLLKSGKHPEIIHCHDWQTGLVPALQWEMYQHLGMKHPRVCFTIHNFKHQGWTGEQVLRATGLNRPEYFFNYDRMRDNGNPQALNLLKTGIVYSNFVTTVSPRHAWEAKDGGQGFGLEPTLHIHHRKYGGVLNGLDYEMFNPQTDRHIAAHYSVQTIEKKYENKRALRNRLWLADNAKPIVAFIGRLDPQKGPELVRHAIFYSLKNDAQFVLLGESPDRHINNEFWALKRQLNDSPDCHLEIGYSDELAHLIYAGADMMIVPSRFEPCGLTQLISLRYGTVPIVRSIGGLADTVFDKDYSDRPLHERNGYVFRDLDNAGIESALNRAISCYYKFPDHFRNLMVNAMNTDYSWNHPGEDYLNIYDYIREK